MMHDLVVNAISSSLLMNTHRVVAQVSELKHHPHHQIFKSDSKSDPISDFA